MADTEREDSCYEPAGVPVTPQARRLGYEFSVYVSNLVWAKCCIYSGASKFETTLDKRIFELIASCYQGMIKRLSVDDTFVFYKFKHFYWDRYASAFTKKKHKVKLGARLFLDSSGVPWLYIFDLERDKIESLKKGTLTCQDQDTSKTDLDGTTLTNFDSKVIEALSGVPSTENEDKLSS